MADPTEGAIVVDSVQTLLTNALQDAQVIGIGESVESDVLNRAFRQLNWLLAEWARKRWMVYRLAEYSFVSTGAQTYNVGNGATVNINPRPDRLEYAFLRFLNSPQSQFPVDLPLDIIQSRENYSQIAVKTIGTLPWRIFYDPVWPVGVLYPWPIPSATIYEIHVGFKVVVPRFTGVTQPINLPPEYESALNWCLAERFRASYGLPEDPKTTILARNARNAIRLANTAVGVLRMPRALRSRGRAYDIRGDTDSF